LIELHHIVPAGDGGPDTEENAMPLCFDCHARVGHYNTSQPRGLKYKETELKKRRDQIYEEHTRHLVPPIAYEVFDRGLPKVADLGFRVKNTGNTWPVRLRVIVDVFIDGELLLKPWSDPLYRGLVLWNLNPGHGMNGHVELVPEAKDPTRKLRVGVHVTVIDIYEREHKLLPVTWAFDYDAKSWWFDPVDPALVRERLAPFPEKPKTYEAKPT
jgi:hypothetical protein